MGYERMVRKLAWGERTWSQSDCICAAIVDLASGLAALKVASSCSNFAVFPLSSESWRAGGWAAGRVSGR